MGPQPPRFRGVALKVGVALCGSLHFIASEDWGGVW